MRIGWRHYFLPGDGFSRGYLQSAFYIYEALKARGVVVEDCTDSKFPPQSRVVLHFCPAHLFQPCKGKKNVLFSMWESEKLPLDWLPALAAADAHVVPSHYCQQVWADHGFAATVAPLGVHDAYRACDASRSVLEIPGRRRRFLWVGSASKRKGWQILAQAWQQAFGEGEFAVELYLKTIGAEGDRGVTDKAMGCGGLVTIDKRDLEPQELLELYQTADVFLFPTFGEGFGLPVLEAMAAGCLAVAPIVGGLSEFVDPETAVVLRRSRTTTVQYGGVFQTQVPTPEDLAPLLRGIFNAWGSPVLERIRGHGIARARTFSWANTAAMLEQVADALAYKGLRAITNDEPEPALIQEA